MNGSFARLPGEPVDRLTGPFLRFLRIEAAGGGVLLLCTLLALVLSNSPWAASYGSFWETATRFQVGNLEISLSLKHWINDGLMTLFFFLVSLELKREIAIGELRNPRTVALPLAAAIGGMLVPAGTFLLVEGGDSGAQGWGTVMATDTAFVIGCLALLGSRVPPRLRLFLLSLAIFDDVGAILVVAIGYGGTLNWVALALAGIGLTVVGSIARAGVRSLVVYSVLGGLIWLAFFESGIHPTFAGVILGLMTPTRSWVSDTRLHAILNRVLAYPPGEHWSGNTEDRGDLRRAGIATKEALSPVERLEIALHPWVAFAILPVFALANAGVAIAPREVDGSVVTAIFLGFTCGKPVGVVLFSYLAVKLRVAVRPPDLPWGILVCGGLLTGIGFTMALFIAELAFDPNLLNSAKLGILVASATAGVGGVVVLAWFTSLRRRRNARGVL